MNSRDNKHGAEIDDSPDNSGSAGCVRYIPKPLYPCIHCAEEHSWHAEDLNWSKREMGWVCDLCWDDRDANWDGEDYLDEDKGISLAEELKRRTEPYAWSLEGVDKDGIPRRYNLYDADSAERHKEQNLAGGEWRECNLIPLYTA